MKTENNIELEYVATMLLMIANQSSFINFDETKLLDASRKQEIEIV